MITREQMPEGNIRLTFSLASEQPAGDVSVVGSFNEWSPGLHPLQGDEDGTRKTSVIVEPGTYHFRYLATDGVWFDDDHADLVGESGGVLHCHRADAPVVTDPMAVAAGTEDVELVLDPESESTIEEESAKTSEKGRRPKAGAAR